MIHTSIASKQISTATDRDADSLTARYEALPDRNKVVFQLKAMLGPDAGDDRVLKCFWNGRITLPSGPVISREQANQVIAEAEAAGLWKPLSQPGSQLLHQVSIDAFDSPQARRFQQATHAAAPK